VRGYVPPVKQFIVNAFWDEEAQVWVADSADVPGLCTEASTVEQLSQKLEVMIPEFLENLPSGVSVHLEAH
jgi:predicted RNase H-like HicB family nuclease